MAELDIGKHCSINSCNRLDFLPFVCTGCAGVFCLEHKSKDGHNCSEAHSIANPVKENGEYVAPVIYTCALTGCKRTEVVPVTCEHCHKNFCLGHRHQTDHQCTELPTDGKAAPMAKTAQLVQDIKDSKKTTGTGVKTKGKGAKSAKMAAKVAMMKMKMHALGDSSIPQKERVFFQVHLPKGHSESHKPMFFSNMWSVGKTVDRIAALLRLKNENNIASAKKLRLFHPERGDVFTMDAKLESLLADDAASPIYSGGGIILEYVENGCTCLPNVADYRTS
ncbi:AN1-type zinc finger protein 1 [Strongylocentrotus purpuratus]|uniref:AN1-type domain-containing protein n=1 Tax=Strongylocentrotus purpuratus TaxID=7668 RepID=A0A7M7N6K5_STRPU|nr:AN1-type zinc finger protein 1 [Strongylocentrotus purpuratus]|eukprot:XP_011668264.1 PREDICTED: AN1-type zinc finger protein 1 [Strongylocentrotus purpuratus]